MIAHRNDHSVDLKRRPPKSLHGRFARCGFPIAKAARKDSAVHVSLSSDSLVKQPETPKDPVFHSLRRDRHESKSRRSLAHPPGPKLVAGCSPCKQWGASWHVIASRGGAPRPLI